jgi:hypothetical protein
MVNGGMGGSESLKQTPQCAAFEADDLIRVKCSGIKAFLPTLHKAGLSGVRAFSRGAS